jgi:ketosteroid isomerase-like protein
MQIGRIAVDGVSLRMPPSPPHAVRALCAAAVLLAACSAGTSRVSPLQRVAAERAIRDEVVSAYDFSKPNVVDNLMSLYAPSGPIVSASAGRVITSRDSLRAGIQDFWNNVGRNMRDPHVEWTSMHIDVLAPDAAVMTATYRIPHKQPNGLPHVIGGAWTAAFVLRDGRWVIVQEHLSDNPYAS